jgi:hypothetical protein
MAAGKEECGSEGDLIVGRQYHDNETENKMGGTCRLHERSEKCVEEISRLT